MLPNIYDSLGEINSHHNYNISKNFFSNDNLACV